MTLGPSRPGRVALLVLERRPIFAAGMVATLGRWWWPA